MKLILFSQNCFDEELIVSNANEIQICLYPKIRAKF